MTFDYRARWSRAATLMDEHGIDALVLMKPANLAYLTGDGRPCSLALFATDGRLVVTAPTCDLPSVRRLSQATDVRGFASEEEMFHGFRDILSELGLSTATLALEKSFFDAALHEVVVAHVLAGATVVPATPVSRGCGC
jgi:Xaa-Pro aminopeptidase